MRTCINGATTMPYSLEVDMQVAGEAGYQGIEIWKSKLDSFLEKRSGRELKDLLKNLSLEAASLCPFGGYVFCPEEEFERKSRELKAYLELAHEIECPIFVVCAENPYGKAGGLKDALEAHSKRLSRLAALAEGYGVRIAMEWFWDLRDAFEVLSKASEENLGMVLDTFHWYRGDGQLDHVEQIPPRRLLLVHVNDCEPLPREVLTDKNRIYCGLGVIPLIEILRRLKGLGYGGYLSVEIFRDEYWRRDALTIASESLEHLRRVMFEATVL
ncbi:MAG: sugar phosphate isomerase/epimerase family protein [Candidatus Bathyarchaeia archaeon]